MPSEGFYTREHSPSQSYFFYPATTKTPAPLMIYVHGGAWRFGSKDSLDHSEYGVHRLREFFSQAGFACASIDYRLSSEAPFPAQIQDVKAAVAHFQKHASNFGIDPEKVVVVGGSAGGHLAMLAAGTGSLGDSYYDGGTAPLAPLAAAVSIYGVSDLRTIYQDRVLCGFPYNHPDDDHAERYLLGSDYPAPEGTEAELNWSKAHPLDLAQEATANGKNRFAPLYLLHGTADTCVPPVQSARVYDALTAQSLDTQLVLVEDAEHSDLKCYTDEQMTNLVDWVKDKLHFS